MATDYDLCETFDDGAPLDLEDQVEDVCIRIVELFDHADHWFGLAEERLHALKISAIAVELKTKCESPIEVEFGAELMAQCPKGFDVYPQFNWQRFRMDFAIISGNRICAFIECDGAEFHSTPAQIQNDQRKNVAAEQAGIPLFRFTGREIFRVPASCAARVWKEI